MIHRELVYLVTPPEGPAFIGLRIYYKESEGKWIIHMAGPDMGRTVRPSAFIPDGETDGAIVSDSGGLWRFERLTLANWTAFASKHTVQGFEVLREQIRSDDELQRFYNLEF